MMERIKDLYRTFIRPPAPQPDNRPTYEQMRDVIELAEEFDRLQGTPVWEKILKKLGAEVNGELVEATKFKYEPQRQVTHTVRWDAKREMLDGILGWMESMQRERDRIIEEFREMQQNGRHTNYTSPNGV